jgi:signal recognition particle receptor subunit beta
VDGVVFVADSQLERIESNLASLAELKGILRHEGIDFGDVPHVIQYNKRDLPNAVSAKELKNLINKYAVPDFETVATAGTGIYDAFKTIASRVLMDLKKTYQ